jgi:penicillin-binding protein 1A
LHTDFNRAVEAQRQAGSALKPVVYVAALGLGAQLDSPVTDEPVAVDMGGGRSPKWISNYDGRFRGSIPLRVALAESRNCATMWIAQRVGVARVIETAHLLGIRSPLQPFLSTALGASEVNLLELANVYRALASGLLAEPHVVGAVYDAEGSLLYERARDVRPVPLPPDVLCSIQEALRGVVRLPSGTAHGLDSSLFPIEVMGKTGTTTDYRDALFVGSTYGARGLTVAVRVGFDDNRGLGPGETGGRVALPIFQRIVRRVYGEGLAGAPPRFPGAIERGIDAFLNREAATSASDGIAVAVSVAAAPGR